MKKKFTAVIIFVLLSGIVAGASPRVGQQEPIAGGYSEAPTTDREVVAAARFAVKQKQRRRAPHLSLVAVEHAERQVVAGLNYKLCLRVKMNGKTREVTTVVYQNLKQKYELTSWEEGRCKQPTP